MSEVKANVRTLADSLVSDYDFSADKGKVTFNGAEEKIKAALPEDMSMDVVQSVQGFLIDTAAAHALALGEVGLKELKKKGSINKITASTRVGYSAVDAAFHRELSGTTAGHDWSKKGKITSSLEIGTGRRNAPFKDVAHYLKEQAESVFSN